MVSENPTLDIKLTKKQRDVLLSPSTEIFFGGAAGPGKSFLMRIAAIMYCVRIPHLQVYLFRRLSSDLRKTHLEGHTGFRILLQPWVDSGHAVVTEEKIRFWNGSIIYLCHCEEEKDKTKYLSSEINLLLIDELTQFTEGIYRYLRGRVRLGSLRNTISKEYQHKFPLILSASNPGGVGHEWVKRTFVDKCPPDGTPVRMPKDEGGKLRSFFAALMTDNPYLEADYQDTLMGLGNEELVEAMRFGNWNVLQGAFWKTFSRRRHFLPPFKIPIHWTRIFGMDWGYYYPFSMGWWAIAEEEFEHPQTKRKIPMGSLVKYRGWYGTVKPGSNRGIDMDPEEAARRVVEIEKKCEDVPDIRMADPDIWKSDKRVTTASLFNKILSKKVNGGVSLFKADNDHDTGYTEMNRVLVGSGDIPEIYWFDNLVDDERCFTNAVRDEKNPDEIADGCEIHACDEARYVIMAKKQGIRSTLRRAPMEIDTNLTYGALLEHADKFEAKRRARRGPLECD